MDPATHIAHLQADAALLLEGCKADPTADVPSCPGWDRTALLSHLAWTHSWIRAQAEAGPGERVRFKASPPAPEGPGLPDWYAANVTGMVAALTAMDTSILWPTWAGDQPGTFYPRRIALETAIHRWDGVGGPVDPALAVDGIDEHLELFAPLASGDSLAAHGTIHLHATDVDGEWLVTLAPSGVTFEHGHADGDVELRGTASDVYLWAWNRVPVDDRFEVDGDTTLLDAWRQGVRI